MRYMKLLFLTLCIAGMAAFAQADEFDESWGMDELTNPVNEAPPPAREAPAPVREAPAAQHARPRGAEKPKVAFYFVGEEPREGVFRPLGGQITKAVVESGDYVAVDRTAALRTLLSSERDYQMSGAVDEDQMASLGKEWGVKYVISIEITRSIDAFYIEAKMVNVEGSYIAKMGNFETKFRSSADVTATAEKLVADLLGSPGKHSGRAARKAEKTEKNERDDKPADKKMMIGLRLAPTFTTLSEEVFTWDDGGLYAISGDGLGADIGLAISYPILKRLRLNAEVSYSHRGFILTGRDEFQVYGYGNGSSSESSLAIPVTLMLIFNEPKPYSLYAEAGMQVDATLSNDYLAPYLRWDDGLQDYIPDMFRWSYRSSSEFGIVFGVGITFNLWKFTSYLGYRAVFGLTPFDNGDFSNALIRQSFGVSILY